SRVPAQVGAALLEPALQLAYVDVAGRPATSQRQIRGGTGRLAHGETGTGDPGRGLPTVGHRCASTDDVEVRHPFRHDHPEWQLVEPPWVLAARPAELDGSRHVGLDRPAV